MGPGTTELLLSNILIGDRLHNIRTGDEQVGGILKSEFQNDQSQSPLELTKPRQMQRS